MLYLLKVIHIHTYKHMFSYTFIYNRISVQLKEYYEKVCSINLPHTLCTKNYSGLWLYASNLWKHCALHTCVHMVNKLNKLRLNMFSSTIQFDLIMIKTTWQILFTQTDILFKRYTSWCYFIYFLYYIVLYTLYYCITDRYHTAIWRNYIFQAFHETRFTAVNIVSLNRL